MATKEMKRQKRLSKSDRLMNELLTSLLINPLYTKLPPTQSQLIYNQFSTTLKILNKYGNTISFKFVDMRKINKV